MDVSEFLRARIAEDERRAEEWRSDDAAVQFHEHGDVFVMESQPWVRSLAECDAKRSIVALFDDADENGFDTAMDACLALAAIYADHPDYQPKWKP